MTYSKERAASISKSDIKYIPAGIIENVVLKSVKTEVSPNGNQFLEIVFEKDGATLTHTEWKPTLGGFVTTEEQLQTKMDKQYSRMLQILNCYYKDEELDFNGESFEQFAQWITDMLNKVDKSKNLEQKQYITIKDILLCLIMLNILLLNLWNCQKVNHRLLLC